MKRHCRGALEKSKPMLHTLLGGPSGIGKTHLAHAVAAEMETGLVEFYSARSSKRIELVERLGALKKPGDVVFIDEIHALPVDCQEILYPAIDELKIPKIDGDKRKQVSSDAWVAIPPFTLIAATDQHGQLLNALGRRLPLKWTLGWYSDTEMRQIVFNRATELGVLLNEQACTRLAKSAKGAPRRARHLLESLHLVMPVTDRPLTKPEIVRFLLESQGMDDNNLTSIDHAYLDALRKNPVLSLQNIARQLGLDMKAVCRDIEEYLIRRGLIVIGSQGRRLTEDGLALAGGCA